MRSSSQSASCWYESGSGPARETGASAGSAVSFGGARSRTRGQAGDSRRVEERGERELRTASFVHPGDHLCRKQGMTAELKEIVVNSNRTDAKQLFPDFGYTTLGFIPGSSEWSSGLRTCMPARL